MSKSKVLNKAIENIYSLTPLQEGMLFYALNDNNSTNYILQSTFRLHFEPQEALLSHAVRALGERYDALRTAIVYEGMAKPRQVVLKDRQSELRWLDLRHMDGEMAEKACKDLQEAEVNAGFDLQKKPLMRLVCVALPGTWKLVWTMHHIIVDGWCMSLLQKDLLRYYRVLEGGMSPEQLSALIARERLENSEYSRYVKWLEKQDSETALLYWQKELEGYEDCVTIRPYEIPTPSERQMECAVSNVSQAQWSLLKEASRKCRVTVGTVLQTAWGLLLKQYQNGEDVVFGKVVSGRNAPIRGIDSMVGLFANTIPVRVQLRHGQTLMELLRDQQQKATEGENYSYCSLAEIQNRVGCGSLIGSLFAFENYSISSEFTDKYSSMMTVEHSREQTSYDLTLSAYEENGEFKFEILYNPNVYSAENINRISAHYKEMLAVVPHSLDLPVAKLCAITEEEKSAILESFNQTSYEAPTNHSLMEVFRQRVMETPDKTAVVFGEERLSYGELNQQSNRIARTLQAMGVQRGDFVAIMTQRGARTIVGLCGILKAGAVYVPIDPGYPEKRIRDIMEDCDPKAILTYGCTIEGEKPVLSLEREDTWDRNTEDVPPVNSPEDIANCIYTSGTSGKPKGVLIRHKAILNLVLDCDYMPFSPETNTVQTGQLVFDASTFEIWGTLMNGGCLHMIPQDLLLNAEGFGAYLREQKINMQFITTALFNQFVSYDPSIFDGMHSVSFGGERVSEDHVKLLHERNPKLRLTNCYGPTEGTVIALRYTIPYGKTGSIPIGTPIHNTKVYILQGESLCGIGVPGELCIAGEGLAAGYLNRPELTEEKFVPNPYGEGKLYRTGDLARWLPDGTVEFMGRIDEQVKIRGFRIELAEIESVIRHCKGVRDCAVIVRKAPGGDHTLCAYVVGAEELNIPMLKQEMAATLPGYMIPPYIMQIEAIPLTRNGKLDRRSLPEMEKSPDRDYTPPRDESETVLAEAFQKVLGVEQVSIYDNFFELGGHSLKCAQLVNLLRGSVSIKDVFEKKTVAELATLLRGSPIEEQTPGIEKVLTSPRYQMSEAQKRLYIFEQMDESKSSYHVTSCYALEGVFDLLRGEKAFRQLIERYESLRTSFAVEGETFRQIIHKEISFQIERIQLEEQAVEEAVKAFLKPYDLSVPQLFRVALAENREGKQWLILDFHHIIIDGFSVDILLRDFTKLYAGEALPEVPFQYKDYSAWMEQKDLQKAKAYWMGQFAEALPEEDLPLDGKRREDLSHEGALAETALPDLHREEVERFCRKNDVTAYAFFTAAVSAFLGRLYDTEDVVLGMPVSCRSHKDTESVVGMLVNTVALRSKPEGNKPFRTYLQEVKGHLLSAMEHQEYPFNQLVEKTKAQRANGRAPLFDVFFNYFHSEEMEVLKGEGFTAKEYPVNIGAGKFDLVFDLILQGESYQLISNYRPALLKKEKVEQFQKLLGNLLLSFLREDHKPLKDAAILSQQQEEQILKNFHCTRAFTPEQSFPEMLRETAKFMPDHTALVFREERLSYGELDCQTDAIASALLNRGVNREDVIGIIAKPGFATFLGAIGIMKAGCAYMPIDPQYPMGRIEHMLRQSHCKLLLKDEETYTLPAEVQTLSVNSLLQTTITQLPKVQGKDLAYVIFTSGSTGMPKGVMIEHHSLHNLICWHNSYYGIKAGDQSTKYAGFGFDASVHEMYPQLAAGATIHIIPEEMRMDLPAIREYMEHNRVNIGFFPTPVCEQFAKEKITCLEKVITGGDKLKTHTEQYPIYNNYGPTEATVLCTAFRVDRDYDNIPIGKPIDNVKIYVVNRHGRLQPIGLPGELWIGGEGIARGYINDPQRTEERFGEDPFCPGGRIYKTGDLGLWLPDGN
ncbi:MAG: amino acid adenylation domain-containing protein, partial [Oscillospiraceae bacterium]|nr:amino acid adenylation domain-containing protein [Oscillospiraceae bacterium]